VRSEGFYVNENSTFRFVAQHLNHCATAVPENEVLEEKPLPASLGGEKISRKMAWVQTRASAVTGRQ